MSIVIDGTDIAQESRYFSMMMNSRLSKLLDGDKTEIPAGVLVDAKNLFRIGMEAYEFLVNGQLPSENGWDSIRALTTYQILTDMIRKSKGKANVDSELETLAMEMKMLTPSGERIKENPEKYVLLRDVFKGIVNIPTGHANGYRIRNQYQYGTFDDGDDD